MYELRANDNPQAMPRGTSTISVHETYGEAEDALSAESAAFQASVYSGGGAYLKRVIVEV